MSNDSQSDDLERTESSSLLPTSTVNIDVLHIDDNARFADMAQSLLERERENFDVTSATTADEGLEEALTGEYDCIVCDYDMTGLNGLQVLNRVRSEYPDMPFILFTGKGSEEIASQAISRGITDYVKKESHAEQYAVLANRIEMAVEQTRTRTNLHRSLNAIETAHHGIALLDEDGTFLYVNDRYAELTGFDSDELVGHTWTKVHPDGEAERLEDDVMDELNGGEWTGDSTYLKPDGDEVEYETTLTYVSENTLAATIKSGGGSVELKKELSLRERAMNEAPVGITISDPSRVDNPIIYANEGFERTTGYATEETVGRNCRFLQGPATDEDTVAELREAIDNEEPVTVELMNYKKDGTPFWNRLTVAPLFDDDGEVEYYVGIQEDVSARKQAEYARTKLIGQYKKLGQMMAHDLGNPIATIQTLMKQSIKDDDTQRIQEAIPAVRRLKSLIDDYTDIIQTGDLIREDMQDIDLAETTQKLWEAVEVGPEGELDVSDAPKIRGDKRAVGRMFDNLLRNAVENAGNDVHVEIGELEDGFYVEDDGPGIPETDRSDAFNAGFTTKDKGKGLGLTSVKQIATAHGWKIQATSPESLGGARFEIIGVHPAKDD